MTPQEKQMLSEIYNWMKARQVQQLSYPVEDATLHALRERLPYLEWYATGATAQTQSLNLTGNVQVIDVPAAYTGTEVVIINGNRREIPYIATI